MKYLRSNCNKRKTVGRVRIQRLLQGALGPKKATRKKCGLLLEGGCPASSVKGPCPALCPEAKHRWGQWRSPCYILAAGKRVWYVPLRGRRTDTRTLYLTYGRNRMSKGFLLHLTR